MTTDCISREAAIKTHCDQCHCIEAIREPETCHKGCIEYLKFEEIPAADVRPVVRGKWEKHEDFDTYGGGRFVEWVCSECDKRLRGDWVIRNSHIEETPTEN